MREVTVLFVATVSARIDRPSTKGAERPPGHDNFGCFLCQLARLSWCQPANKRWCTRVIRFQIVRNDDQMLAVLIEPELHPAGADLMSRIDVEFFRHQRGCRRLRTTAGKVVEDLLERLCQSSKLLFFQPDDAGLAIDDGQQAEAPLARFTYGLG